jgi:DNA-directed RNA polymerase II subunit RPB2
MLSEKHRWKILDSHFKSKGFVHHQTESFNNFLNLGLPRIITEEPPIIISRDGSSNKECNSIDYESYTIQFSDLYIPKPTVTEEDRSLRNLYPGEARQRDLTYDSPIYVTVTTIMEPGNGAPAIVEKNIRVVIGRIPIMLRSSHCYLTNMTPQERINSGECEYDSGGYFVVKGKERVLIPQLRGVYNIPLVLKQKSSDKFKYIAEMRSMSEETGHSVLIQALIGSDDRTLVFSLPYIKEHIPIGVVFKALGYVSENAIRNLIGLDCKLTDRYIRLIIRDAFFCEEQCDGLSLFLKQDDNKPVKDRRNSKDLKKLWSSIGTLEKQIWKDKMTRDNALNYIGKFTLHTLKEEDRREYALQVVESELFPHMGITSTLKEKAYLLGSIVNRLLSTSVGIRKDNDRDDYKNKRVESAGMLCLNLFRQLFKKFTVAIVSSIEKKKQNPDAMAIISRLPTITKGLQHCFGTGNWGVPKNSYIRCGVAQILSRLSYGATLSNLRRVTIPVGKESKNSKIRQIHPSQIMYLCPSETPEGQSIGIVLNLSLLTSISSRFPTVLAKEIIEDCEELITLRDFEGPNDKTKVFLNGVLIGMTEDSDGLIEEIIKLRSIEILPYDVSVSYDDIDDEINVFSDDGRLLRPVFTVSGDSLDAKEEDGTNWNTLVKKGYIRYLDNSEIGNTVVAFSQEELKKYHNDYCEIAPAMMLGVMASIIPFPDHSQSPRNCYQSAMGKQAMSMFALSHLIRTDTVTHVLTYPQKPLVSTRTANMMGFSDMPSGINTVVAIACYEGWNQEDSVLLNHGAVQRGLFWSTTYRTHSTEEKKRGSYTFEKIGNPPLDVRRGDANYSLLDKNGVVRLRHPVYTDKNGKKVGGGAVYVEKGDVIIGKILIKSDKTGKEELSDNSLVIKKGEEGYIDRIFSSITPNGYQLVKVVIRKTRIPEVGDKFASRAAQKGTCGAVYAQEDMPWTRDGITPDIIMNPHALPSRMTINQLMESVLGKSCCIEGKLGDSTPFTESSVNIAEKLCDRLGMNGYGRTGTEMLYSGITGKPMGKVFIGTVYYQRLKHLVDDKMHARAQGPNATLTRQPLEGRSRDGGLRFGEMERDCYCGSTLISLSCGLSIKMNSMIKPGWNVLSWDNTTRSIIKAKQTHYLDKGKRPCVELRLQDDRTIILTHDHPLLTNNGNWIKAKDLDLENDKLKVGMRCPEMDIEQEINDCSEWSLEVGKLTFKAYNMEEYLRTLAFARIIGILTTDGHITKDRKAAYIYLGHKLDVQQIQDDFNLLGCDVRAYKKAYCYTIGIPRELSNEIVKLKGLTFGNKVRQESKLPEFILDKNCPKPILREFIAGMFGGDGHTSYLGLHRGKRDLLTSVGFSGSKIKSLLGSHMSYMTQIAELLTRLGIPTNKITLQKPKVISDSKNKEKNGDLGEKTYEIVLHIDMDYIIYFGEKIGFRYCCHKSQRLDAAISYKQLRRGVVRQRNWLIHRVGEITNYIEHKNKFPNKNIKTKKAIEKAVKELEETEGLLHPYAIPTKNNIYDVLIRGCKFGSFINKSFPNADEYMKEIGVIERFDGNFGVHKDADGLPAMNLKIVSRKDVGMKEVCDISVENTHSFLGEGVVSHNCIMGHGASRFLKERLCDQSDPYIATICNKCGNFSTSKNYCKACDTDKIAQVNLPYVSKLVIQELNAMLIKCKITAKGEVN